jgi:hypothetical protein
LNTKNITNNEKWLDHVSSPATECVYADWMWHKSSQIESIYFEPPHMEAGRKNGRSFFITSYKMYVQIGCGIKSIQIRRVRKMGAASKAFFLLRHDGTIDDFSSRRCIMNLFPSANRR